MIDRAATLDGGGPAYPACVLCSSRAAWRSIDSVEERVYVDEHRALMGAVVERIQSAESGLNESCFGLIKAFEVCFLRNL